MAVYLTDERRAALALMGPAGVRAELAEARALMGQLVGDLWPEILAAEIDDMEAMLRGMTGDDPPCPDCGGSGYVRLYSETVVCGCVGREA